MPSGTPWRRGQCFRHRRWAVPGLGRSGEPPSHPEGAAGVPAPNALTCAGTTGCHGDRTVGDEFGAVAGGHHGPGGAANGYVAGDATDMSDAFRMLGGVAGVEDADWEYTVSATDHNLYKGDVRTSEAAVAASTSISSLCAQCHGAFHNGVGSLQPASNVSFGTPWVRHPTDFDMSALATTSEYAGYTAYSTEAPVAVETMGTTTVVATTTHAGGLGTGDGNAIVTCISCHRAHGSPYDDLLRWQYSTMDAHNGTTGNVGCFQCHTTKDDA